MSNYNIPEEFDNLTPEQKRQWLHKELDRIYAHEKMCKFIYAQLVQPQFVRRIERDDMPQSAQTDYED